MTSARTIAHVDMDAFFAAIEIRDDPSLDGRPVLVGGIGKRGVVASANYIARQFGCRSAQPMALARKLCPHAVVLPSRHARYVEVSRNVFEVLREYAPVVEAVSIDEAFLDLSGTEKLWGRAADVAQIIRKTMHARVGLTCSVGIASGKMIAKMASELAKPDGWFQVEPGREVEFLQERAIEQLWGIGPRASARLRQMGISTIGELAVCPEARLQAIFGRQTEFYLALARGKDPRSIVADHRVQQISHEETFEDDCSDIARLRAVLLDQACRVADRLYRGHLAARTVRLKLRDHRFTTRIRQRKLTHATCDARALFVEASALLEHNWKPGERIRLLGLAAAELCPAHAMEKAHAQLELDYAASERTSHEKMARMEGMSPPTATSGRDGVQAILSAVRQRYGAAGLYFALADENEPRRSRRREKPGG